MESAWRLSTCALLMRGRYVYPRVQTSRLAGSARAAVEQLQLLGSRWRVPFPMHAAWQLQQTAALRTATQPKQVRNTFEMLSHASVDG